jgi:hypothetical protein
MHNHYAKLPVELALSKSGMAFTILLPRNLMQSTEAFFWNKVWRPANILSHGRRTRKALASITVMLRGSRCQGAD